ncbi:MAG: PAS domain S-box protein [Candidatus Helarchaeota archaeon]
MGSNPLDFLIPIFNKVQFAVILTTPQGKVKYCNPSTERIFGYSAEELIGKDFVGLDKYPEETVKKFKTLGKNILKHGTIEPFEFQAYRIDNSLIWVNMILIPINIDNEILIQVIIQDINDRITAEMELIKSKAQLQYLLGASPAVIYSAEPSTRFHATFISANVETLTGYNIDELLNAPEFWEEHIHPDDQTTVLKERARIFDEGTYSCEYRIRCKNGDYRWIIDSMELIYDETRKPVEILGSWLDISERYETEEKLRASEKKFRDMVDLLPDIIFETDNKLNITYVNSIGLKKFGYTREDFKQGLNLLNVVAEEDYELAMRGVNMILQGNKGIPGDYLLKKKDGTYFWARVYVAPIVQEDKVIGIRGVVSDISKRKQAERQLRESEEKFKMITEQSLMGILILQDGVIKYANEAVSTISEFTIGELLSWPPNYFINLVYPADRDFVMKQAVLKQKGERGAITHYYYRIFTKSKAVKWISQYSKTVQFQGKPADLVTLIDITERRLTEQKLKESEEHFRTISEQLLMGICILQDDRIIYVNQEYADLFGYSIEEMLQWKPLEYMKAVHPKDKRRIILKEQKKHAVDTESSIQYSFRGLRRNGEIIWLECYSKSIKYRDRPADLIMVTNITAKIDAEKSLRESERQYREAFNRAEFYKDLLSHDISNILQSIMFSAESSLLMLDNRENLRKRLLSIKEEVKRSGKLVANVRKLSMLEKGTPHVYPVNVIDYLKRALKYIQSKFLNTTITTKFDAFDQKVFALANEFLIDVFENILDNSMKYNKKLNIEIIIRIRKELKNNENYVKIEIMDNGIGIKDEYKKLIFQRGYREGGDVGGSGLGLSLSLKILSSYNGDIWVEDRVPGDYKQGSNFILLIPKA